MSSELDIKPGKIMDPENEYEATNNIKLIATIDLTLATVGIMLDVFVLSEGRSGEPYRVNGQLYPGNQFFYFAWGVVFVLLLGQGLMAINLFSSATKFESRPLKYFKRITTWQLWSIGFLIVLIGAGVPVFALSNQMDEFYGFTITYLMLEIGFRLCGLTCVEFNRDKIKREKFFPRVLPPSSSLIVVSASALANANKEKTASQTGLLNPIYVNVMKGSQNGLQVQPAQV